MAVLNASYAALEVVWIAMVGTRTFLGRHRSVVMVIRNMRKCGYSQHNITASYDFHYIPTS